MTFSLLLQLAAVPILIAANAFFVIAEYALVAVRNSQIETRRVSHSKAARALLALKKRMGSAIGTIQICITMNNLLLGWVGEPAMTAVLQGMFGFSADFRGSRAFGVASTVLSFVVVTLLTVVLSELVPKAVTLQHTLPLALWTARPVLAIQRSLKPLVWLMDKMANATTRLMGLGEVRIGELPPSAEELGHITSEAADSGNLTPRERTLILNSLTLGRRTAEEIMVPRVNVSYLDLQRTMAENQQVIGRFLFSRFPVCDGGMDHIVGVIYTKEFLTALSESAAAGPVGAAAVGAGPVGAGSVGVDSGVLQLLVRPPVYAPMSVPLDRLLQVFAERRTHMVFLVDELGGVRGTVTLTDVVDEVIGKIREGDDADDDAETVLEHGNGYLIVRGQMPLTALGRALRHETFARGERVQTVGGLLTARLGRVPAAGETLEIDGVRLMVQECTERSVQRVRAERQ